MYYLFAITVCLLLNILTLTTIIILSKNFYPDLTAKKFWNRLPRSLKHVI